MVVCCRAFSSMSGSDRCLRLMGEQERQTKCTKANAEKNRSINISAAGCIYTLTHLPKPNNRHGRGGGGGKTVNFRARARGGERKREG